MPGPFDFINEIMYPNSDQSGIEDKSPAGDNPFANMPLPPRGAAASGTLMGTIDHLMGVPTNERIQAGNQERMAARELQRTDDERRAEADIMQRVGEIRTNNPTMPPQQLFSSIVADPVFARNAARIKDSTKLITGIQGLIQPPPPTQINTPAGGRTELRNPMTPDQPGEVVTNPTGDVQEIDRIMRMTPDELAQYRVARQAQSRARQPNMREEALEELERMGTIDRTTRLKIEGGTLAMTPIMDPLRPGVVIGHRISDLTQAGLPERVIPAPPGPGPGPGGPNPTNPPAPPVTPPGSTEVPRGPTTGLPPGTNPNTPRTPDRVPAAPPGGIRQTDRLPQEAAFDPANPSPNLADMFDSLGPVGAVTGVAGRLAGNIDPRLGAARTQAQQGQIATLQTQLQLLRQGGRQFARDQQMLSSLVPSEGQFFTNPENGAVRVYALQGFLQGEAEAARREFQNNLMSNETRGEAAKRLQAIEGVLRAMPDREALRAKIIALSQGQGGTTIQDLLKTIPGVQDLQAVLNQGPRQQPTGNEPANPSRIRAPNGALTPETQGNLTPEDASIPPREFPADLSGLSAQQLTELNRANPTPEQRARIRAEAKRRIDADNAALKAKGGKR